MSFPKIPKPVTVRRLARATAAVAMMAGPALTPAVAFAHSGSHKAIQIINSPSALALNNAMRELWAQHMEWTYAAVTAYATGSHAFDATVDRDISAHDCTVGYRKNGRILAFATIGRHHVALAQAQLFAAQV